MDVKISQNKGAISNIKNELISLIRGFNFNDKKIDYNPFHYTLSLLGDEDIKGVSDVVGMQRELISLMKCFDCETQILDYNPFLNTLKLIEIAFPTEEDLNLIEECVELDAKHRVSNKELKEWAKRNLKNYVDDEY